jgi:hypothetical protein
MLNFNQEADVWNALQTEENPVKQHFFLVQLAHLLLNKAHQGIITTPLKNFPTEELTGLMIEYRQVAADISQFFDVAIPLLDPEYQGTPFEEKLHILQKELSSTIEKTEIIKKQIQTLSVENEILSTEQKTLEEIQEKLKVLEKNNIQLTETVDKLQIQKEKFSKMSSELTGFYNQGMSEYIDSINLLKECMTTIQNSQSIHFDENEKIFEVNSQNMNSTNLDELKMLSKSIEDNLGKYDLCLKEILEKRA